MGLFTAIACYFVLFWIALFMVLPWGVRSQAEEGRVVPGSDPGAPARPHLRRKFMAAAVLALALLGVLWGLITYDVFDISTRV